MEFLAAGGKALDPAQTQQLFESQDMGVTPLDSLCVGLKSFVF